MTRYRLSPLQAEDRYLHADRIARALWLAERFRPSWVARLWAYAEREAPIVRACLKGDLIAAADLCRWEVSR